MEKFWSIQVIIVCARACAMCSSMCLCVRVCVLAICDNVCVVADPEGQHRASKTVIKKMTAECDIFGPPRQNFFIRYYVCVLYAYEFV